MRLALICALLLVACAPSQGAIETAVYQTQLAAPTVTVPVPTQTPFVITATVAPTETPQLFRVLYRVYGTDQNGAKITVNNSSGGQDQYTTYLTPSKQQFEYSFFGPGHELFVSVTSTLRDGAVACEIIVNGERKHSAAATGDRVSAICQGST